MFEEKPIPWHELFETLIRRWRTVAACALAGLGGAILLTWLTPPVYKASARLLLSAQAVSGPRQDAMSDRQIQAELAYLESPALIRGVLDSYQRSTAGIEPARGPLVEGWHATVRFVQNLYSRLHDVPPMTPLDAKVEAIAAQIEASPIERSNVVEVAYTGSNPEWAARFVNDLITHHVERIAELNEQAGARRFFQQQSDLLAARKSEARAALAAFREEQGASLLAGDDEQLKTVLADLDSKRVGAETEVLELSARVDFLSQEIGRYPQTIAAESRVTENESVKLLEAKILDLEMQRSELISRYTLTSTLVSDLDRQIEEARRLLATKEANTLSETMTTPNPAHQTLEVELVQARAALIAAQARVGALSSQIAQYRRRMSDLEAIAAELERLETEVANAQEAHQNYVRKAEEARFLGAMDESRIVNVSLLERAEVPLTPEPSEILMRTLLGALLGLAFGVVLAIGRDWLDPAIQSGLQAERMTGLPVIAEIPSR